MYKESEQKTVNDPEYERRFIQTVLELKQAMYRVKAYAG